LTNYHSTFDEDEGIPERVSAPLIVGGQHEVAGQVVAALLARTVEAEKQS